MEGGLLEKLGIDWRLFSAQLINFGLLLLILYKFLYKPILEMLKKRSEMIERSVQEAKQVEENAKRAHQLHEQMLAQAKQETAKILGQGKDLALREREEILKKAQSQADIIIAETKKSLAREKEIMVSSLQKEMGSLVGLAMENIFTQKPLSSQEQERLVKEAIKSIETSKHLNI